MPNDDGYSFPVACPRCGHTADVADCDCIGADEGNVFCPKCGGETATVPKDVPPGETGGGLFGGFVVLGGQP